MRTHAAAEGAEIGHEESKVELQKAIRRASVVKTQPKMSVIVDGDIRFLPDQASIRLIELKAATALKNDPVKIQYVLDAFCALKAHPEAEQAPAGYLAPSWIW